MDKASVPIWAFVALIVVLDLNHKTKIEVKKKGVLKPSFYEYYRFKI